MNKMKRPLVITLIAGLLLARAAAPGQEAKPANKPVVPAVLPGKGLAQHDFFYAGEARTRDMYIVRAGQVAWSYNDATGMGEISDAVLLSNSNILFAHQFGVTLITPDKKVLWNYNAPTNCEIHTAQPIGTNHVIFIQNGPEPRLFVANLATGKMERELPLPVGNPKSTHGQFRHARLTDTGTYLVAHMDLGKVIEYDETGKQVWSAAAPGMWSAVRLKNGNTLVCGKGVREINSKGETVWQFTSADVPDYKFDSLQIATRLPNGNTLINNWVNQWNGKINPDTAPVQALEITPDKKVVWALRSWSSPNLGPSTTIQLLDEPAVPENMHFGSIQ
jgi:PQQ-like domain